MRAPRAINAVAPVLLGAVALVWFVNLLWTLRLFQVNGGSALGGSAGGGRYILALNGARTPVSQAVWETVRLHELIMWWGAPVAIACFAVLLLAFVFPTLMGMRQGADVAERARELAAGGAPLGVWWTGGSVAGVSLGGLLMRVTVYSGGLTVATPLRQPAVILKREIREITWKPRRVTIAHSSPDILSPLFLNLWLSDGLEAALRGMEP